MMAGKVVGLGFEIISKLDSYFLMTVRRSCEKIWKLQLVNPKTLRSPCSKFPCQKTQKEAENYHLKISSFMRLLPSATQCSSIAISIQTILEFYSAYSYPLSYLTQEK